MCQALLPLESLILSGEWIEGGSREVGSRGRKGGKGRGTVVGMKMNKNKIYKKKVVESYHLLKHGFKYL